VISHPKKRWKRFSTSTNANMQRRVNKSPNLPRHSGVNRRGLLRRNGHAEPHRIAARDQSTTTAGRTNGQTLRANGGIIRTQTQLRTLFLNRRRENAAFAWC